MAQVDAASQKQWDSMQIGSQQQQPSGQKQNRYAHLITSGRPASTTAPPKTTIMSSSASQTTYGQQMNQESFTAARVTINTNPTTCTSATYAATTTNKPPPLGASSQRPTNANYYTSFSNVDWREQWIMIKDRLLEKVDEPQSQRKLILFIVCCALLLDNMLYMVIVPIIPDYLRHIGAWSTYAENAEYRRLNKTDRMGQPKWERISGQLVYEGEDSAVGFLFASKAIVQLFINPFSGAIIDRIGYEIPMMIGLIVMFFSTMVFACGQTYTILFLARSLQGVGSAFADTSGLAMIADRFTEENERQRALGVALAFISFGCLVAPPFGSVLYQAAGKEVPFIILSLICLLDGSLLILVTPPGTFGQLLPSMYQQRASAQEVVVHQSNHDAPSQGIMKTPTAQERRENMQRHKSISRRQSMTTASAGEAPKGTPIYVLFRDPYIACCAGALVIANVSLAFLEPTISIWVQNTMSDIEEWQMGMIWLPAFVPHVLGVYLTVKLADKYPRYQWLIAAIGLVLEGVSCIMLPFCSSFWSLIIPISIICFGLALIDTAILPTLGFLVDSRYVSVYGSIYAIADISYSLSYAIGPIIAGGIVEAIGFTALNLLIAVVTLGYTPILMMLRSIHDYEQLDPDPTGLKKEQAKEAMPFGQFGRQPIREVDESLERDEVEYHEVDAPDHMVMNYDAGDQWPNDPSAKTRYDSPTWANKIQKRKPVLKKGSSGACAEEGEDSAANQQQQQQQMQRRRQSTGSTHQQVTTNGSDNALQRGTKKLSFKISEEAPAGYQSTTDYQDTAGHEQQYFEPHQEVDEWSSAQQQDMTSSEEYQGPGVVQNPFLADYQTR